MIKDILKLSTTHRFSSIRTYVYPDHYIEDLTLQLYHILILRAEASIDLVDQLGRKMQVTRWSKLLM